MGGVSQVSRVWICRSDHRAARSWPRPLALIISVWSLLPVSFNSIQTMRSGFSKLGSARTKSTHFIFDLEPERWQAV
jgi:hypothetical protein